ncbi:Peptidoglycan lipid II flippase MurJ [Candidatus Syntrophocurvum alkaliphilum]|uniref:Probable lipid II flippase MurJ n=1 Tax=Candidatus Syntrophocurvum alkaliphilum TaxID=2293317 RepID=A0A6I6DEF4_9FIRM|nr:murein biosynthesis integral membrane protein MurJ [Candidatus Syntrophocurvum alkaliphilum]QGU00486.1 Peptidoglycan lipid II flippase MurJ [Candidatus Syntrophocurvum alkaliphilum]
MSNQSIAKAAVVILAFSTIGRLLGFVREQVIAAQYGTSVYTDAYVMAFTLPNLLYIIIGGALATAFIPVFTSIAVQKGEEEASHMASSVINLTIIGMVVVSIIGVLIAPLLVAIIAPGFEQEARELTIELTRIMFPAVLFLALSMLIGGILNSYKRFAAAAFAPVAFSGIIIISVFTLVPLMGIYGLALGTVLGTVAQVAIQLPFLKRLNLRYKLEAQIKNPAITKMGELMFPAMIGTSVNQLYVTIDRILASGLATGSIAALNFANKLMFLPYNLFVMAINTAVFPSLSEQAAKQKFEDMGRTTVFGLNLVAFFTIPAAIGIFVLSEPLVRLLFERGAFDAHSTELTVFALNFYLIGLFAQGAFHVLNRTYFAMQDTKTPVKINIFSVFLNLIFSLILIRYLAHGGLALATSLAAICNMILVYSFLRRKLPTLPERQLFFTLGKVLFASVIMGVAVHFSSMYLVSQLAMVSLWDQLVHICGSIFIGVLVYGLAILPLKIEEVEYVKDRFLERLARR